MGWRIGMLTADAAAGGDSLTSTARLVEDLGYDWIAAGDHVMFSSPILNSFVALAHVGAVTTRIELLNGVALAPLYPAAVLAKLATSVDVTSNGRFNLGVGVGGEYPAEFEACGVPVSERGARTDEALALLGELWSGDGTVDFDGRFARVHGRMRPRPPHRVPIWVGGRKEAAVRRAARYGDVWYPYLVTAAHVEKGVGQLRRELSLSGRDPSTVSTIVSCFVSIDRDSASARRVAADHVGRIYKRDMSGVVDSLMVAGTAQQCLDQLASFAAAGAGGVVVSLVGERDGWTDRIRLFTEDVVPSLRKLVRSTS